MARPSQSKHLDEQPDGDNIVVARPNQPESAPDNNNITPSRTSTRIPETILPDTATPARPTTTRRDPRPAAADNYNYNPTNEPIHHLRIRNAIQREELRSRNRELRRAQQESDKFERGATEAREQILDYREKLRATTVRMERSVFGLLVVVLCVVLYVGWCQVNSAEFEFQNRVMRRNFGLD